MRRSVLVLFLIGLAAVTSGRAQVVESATARQFTITAGAMGSAFHPGSPSHPIYGPGSNFLAGPGAYVDFHFTHWINVEAEGRWMRFHEHAGEQQDNYLIGPKVPIVQFGRLHVYGKALIGLGRMTFPSNYGYGSFTALAFGGGVDYRLSRKLTLRALDAEYQDWPAFVNDTSLHPYGVSVGVAYRVF